MTTKINAQGVAVDHGFFWQPMSTCPLNTKVQLLNAGRVAVYGKWDGKSDYWLGWAPLPKYDEARLGLKTDCLSDARPV